MTASSPSTKQLDVANVNKRSVELIAADGECPRIAELLRGASHGITVINDSQNPLELIAAQLEARCQQGNPIQTLHLVAHGRPGAFWMGKRWIDAKALIAHADSIARWGVREIAIWSCEVGMDANFLAILEEVSGASVYASKAHVGLSPTSNLRNWSLEVASERPLNGAHSTEVVPPFSGEILSRWGHSLATINIEGVFKATKSYDPSTFFDEETSKVDIDIAAISQSGATFSQAGVKFTGNNVPGSIDFTGLNGSPISINGLASRPIKVNGIVKGFYVWVDNAPAGSSAADEAYVLSLDNSYFEANPTINSSSDRVDNSLNTLLLTDPLVGGGTDTDGDGVANGDDLDDDNDGILDTVEQGLAGGSILTPETLTFNYAQNTSGAASQHDAAATYKTGDRNDPSFLFDGDINTEQRVHIDDIYEFGLPSTIGSGASFTLTEGTGSNDAKCAVLGSLGSTDPNGNANNSASGGQGWKTIRDRFNGVIIGGTARTVATVADLELIFIANGNQPVVSPDGKSILLFAGPSNATQTLATSIDIDNIQIVGLGTHGGWSELALAAQVDSALDTDGDGIPNSLDLDSDNDGISDLNEAVGSLPTDLAVAIDANRDGTISANEVSAYNTSNGTSYSLSANGVWSLAGNPSTVDDGNSPLDTDGDGIPDFLDLDSDGDAIPDTVEARPSSGFVGNDGDVTNDDSDGDGVLNQFDVVTGFGGSFAVPVNTDSAKESGELIFENKSSISALLVNTSVENKGGAPTLQAALATADTSKYAKFNNSSDKLVVDLTGGTPGTLPAGSVVIIRALKTDSKAGNQLVVSQSDATGSAGSLANTVNQSFTTKGIYEEKYYTLTADTRYITLTFARERGDLRIDQIQWATTAGVQASTPDYLDLDSDQDGVSDLVESGLTPNGLDANQDGADDGIDATYLDPNGSIAPNDGTTVDLKTLGTLLNNDGAGASAEDVDYRSTPSDPSVEITDVEVNEGSPYAVLNLSVFNGTSNIDVTLDLINDTDPDTQDATIGTDTGTLSGLQPLQYLNGSTWSNYTGGTVRVDGTNGLLVRVAIKNDNPAVYEGPETLRVKATYGASNRVASGGLITIYDDGTGEVFLEANKTGEPNQPGDAGFPAQLDDDRPIAINNVFVNEGSPFGAVFTLNAPAGAQFNLSVGSAGSGTGFATVPPGADADTGTPLKYSTDGGASWQTYTPGTPITAPADGVVYVSVPIINDPVLETKETFKLVATRTAGNTAPAEGIGTIYDDGRGDSWPINGITPDPNLVPDDDTPIHINEAAVNEGSPWIPFLLEGIADTKVKLSLESRTATLYSGTGGLDAINGTTDFGEAIQVKISGVWSPYVPGSEVALEADGHLNVRVAVNQDTKFEGSETFILRAKTGSNFDISSVGGQGLIRDDGLGTIYDNNGDEDNQTIKDDDRPSGAFTDGDEIQNAGDAVITGSLLANADPNPSSDGPLSIESFSIAGESGPFVLGQPYSVAGKGEITISADGDYVFTPAKNYAGSFPVVTYVVTDGVGPTDTSTLTINVTPVDDLFTDADEALSVDEGSGATTGDLLANATPNPTGDGALSIVSFSIAGESGTFTLGQPYTVAGKGEITVNANGSYSFTPDPDYNGPFPAVTYTVSDGFGATDDSTLEITVKPSADQDLTPPVIDANQVFEYRENRIAGFQIGTVRATDNVGVTSFSFEDTGTSLSPDGFYEIDDSGKIRITAAGVAAGEATNDYELEPNDFTYGIEANDAEGNFSAPVEIALKVLDIDENDKVPPVIEPGQTFSYPENRGGVTVLGQVQASDNDGGSGLAGFRFADSGTTISADGFYAIDDTGTISLTEAGVANLATNDFETTPNSFTYAIQALDAAGNASEPTDVVLNVTDLDDISPLVADQAFSYFENRTAGTQVGAVVATDNVGVTSFRFAETGTSTSADGFYQIDNSGKIRITAAGVAAGQATNDFETTPNAFTYQIQAGDAAGNFSEPAAITLNVRDVNENDQIPPTVAAGQSFSYPENRGGVTVLGQVQASDDEGGSGIAGFLFADSGTNISADGFYAIDDTGTISLTEAGVANLATNDFETAPNSFTYAIQALDAAGNASEPTDVVLTVTDLDDTSPVVADQAFSYFENRTADFLVATVAATDNVGVTSFRFAETGTSTSADGFYEIDNTGRIRITAAGVAAGEATNDFETTPNAFTYQIQAGDAAGNFSAPAEITLNVRDIDENQPSPDITVVGAPRVSEGNPAVFGVSLSSNDAGAEINLALGGDEDSAEPDDYSPLEGATAYYFDANDVKQPLPIVDGVVFLPAGVTDFYVSVPTTPDSDFEGPESFGLTASSGGKSGSGSSTIVDDGSGEAYDDKGQPIPNGGPFDDDRPLAVTGTTVNEASPYVLWTVSGAPGQKVELGLGRPGDTATIGEDTGRKLEVLVDGAWQPYNPAQLPEVGPDGELLVRVAVKQDDLPEGRESLTLTATNTGGTAARDRSFITDDGTGDIFTEDNTSNDPNQPGDPGYPAQLDDDRPLAVDGTTVNEASPYVLWTVSGAPGQKVALDLGRGSDTATIGEDTGRKLEVLVNGEWQPYNPDRLPRIAADGELLVRVAVKQDDLPEGRESLTLTATNTGGTAARDRSFITDDGTGAIFTEDNTSNEPNQPGDPGYPAQLDDDRPLAVAGTTVNEASPYVLWTVSGAPGQKVELDLGRGSDTATIGEDTGRKLEVLVDGVWQPYNPDRLPRIAADGELLVRVAVKQDDLPEGRESLTLTATNTGGTAARDRSFITDDGTGAIFTEDNTSNDPNQPGDPGYPAQLDDDRPLAVAGTTVNEASPYVLWTVSGAPGQKVELDLGRGSDTATIGDDTGRELEVLVDGVWQPYNPEQLPEVGPGGELLVRLAVKQDDLPEGRESLTLTASNAGGTPARARSFITDDGTGDIFTEDNTSNEPNQPGDPGYPAQLDDDRPLAVSGTTVNEASPYVLWTVSGAPGQKVELDLGRPGDTATVGEDTGRKLEVLVDGVWQPYNPEQLPEVGPGGELLVRLAVKQDDLPEGRESLTLTATNTGGTPARARAFITDDGTGDIFTEDNTSNEPNKPGDAGYPDQLDDDRPLAVAGTTVNEASPYVLWTVSGAPGQKVELDLGLPGNTATVGEDTGRKLEVLVDGAWVAYNPDQLPEIGADGELLVRVAVKQDDVFEGRESITLTASNTGGTPATGSSFITDDGTGAIFTGDNTSNVPNQPGDDGYPAKLDDDRGFTLIGQLDSVANSGSVSDDVTADGLAKMEFSGDPGLAGFLTLNGPDGQPLVAGEQYIVREVVINPRKSTYVVELLDADLTKPGAQSFGDYYRGAATGNDSNVADGVYSLLYNNQQVVSQFVIGTNPLDNHVRLKCLEKVFSGTASRGAFESILFGHRIEQAEGTRGDDILNGSPDLSDVLSGGQGSDFLSGVGYRFAGDRVVRPAREQVDVLIGGSDDDFFRLGDVVGAYYVRGGDRDYAVIRDLGQGEDGLVLSGEARRYRAVDDVTVGDHTGVGLYAATDSGRDLMAIIQGPAAQSLLGVNDRLNPTGPVSFA